MLTTPTTCKACGRTIWFLKMEKSGKLNPITDDCVSHYADCPKAKEFRGTKIEGTASGTEATTP
jgi:hypothetical protein